MRKESVPRPRPPGAPAGLDFSKLPEDYYTKTQKGEPLKTTGPEIRAQVEAGMLEQIPLGDFQGINPNAFGGLRDDLSHWAYRGYEKLDLSDERRIEFTNQLLDLMAAGAVKPGHEAWRQSFIREAIDIRERATARLNGNSDY